MKDTEFFLFLRGNCSVLAALALALVPRAEGKHLPGLLRGERARNLSIHECWRSRLCPEAARLLHTSGSAAAGNYLHLKMRWIRTDSSFSPAAVSGWEQEIL